MSKATDEEANEQSPLSLEGIAKIREILSAGTKRKKKVFSAEKKEAPKLVATLKSGEVAEIRISIQIEIKERAAE